MSTATLCPSGAFNSSTIIVMMTAITPSLNASSLPVPISIRPPLLYLQPKSAPRFCTGTALPRPMSVRSLCLGFSLSSTQPSHRNHRHDRRHQPNHQKYRQLFTKRIPRPRHPKIHIHGRDQKPPNHKCNRRRANRLRRTRRRFRRRHKNPPRQQPTQNNQPGPHSALRSKPPSLSHSVVVIAHPKTRWRLQGTPNRMQPPCKNHSAFSAPAPPPYF